MSWPKETWWFTSAVLNQTTLLLLLLQPDHSLPPDRLHGHPWLHPATGLGGEARARSDNNNKFYKDYFFCLGVDGAKLGFEDEKTKPENDQEDDIDEGCRQAEYFIQVNVG